MFLSFCFILLCDLSSARSKIAQEKEEDYNRLKIGKRMLYRYTMVNQREGAGVVKYSSVVAVDSKSFLKIPVEVNFLRYFEI